jgi:hypothetical protein
VVEGLSGQVTTERLCRRAYPDAEVIEKKHRVAVLQVLHRLMSTPPRPFDARVVRRGKKRGTWIGHWASGTLQNDHEATAYHEAGHALADLYFGHGTEVIHVEPRAWKLKPGASAGFVLPKHKELDRLSSRQVLALMCGAIAEAHYRARWPYRRRGIHRTYDAFFAEGGRSDAEKIENLLGEISEDPAIREAVRAAMLKRAQALIRSEPGWRFIETLASELMKRKRGRMRGQSRAAVVFQRAFGRAPPEAGDWFDYVPTLQRLRVGWLPLPASRPSPVPG